jgi:hypothetical protein
MTTIERVKHTPGPWHIGMKPGPIVYGPQGEQVANMLPCMLERDEHNANARLIAAAPALLEIVERFIQLSNNLAVALTAEQIAEATSELSVHSLDAQILLNSAKGTKPL